MNGETYTKQGQAEFCAGEGYPGIAHDYETARTELARQSDVMRAQAEQIADLMAQRERLTEQLAEAYSNLARLKDSAGEMFMHLEAAVARVELARKDHGKAPILDAWHADAAKAIRRYAENWPASASYACARAALAGGKP